MYTGGVLVLIMLMIMIIVIVIVVVVMVLLLVIVVVVVMVIVVRATAMQIGMVGMHSATALAEDGAFCTMSLWSDLVHTKLR
eukprot:SAG11_NODE_11811_length_737_cov_1.064263_1_plen_82_part_00